MKNTFVLAPNAVFCLCLCLFSGVSIAQEAQIRVVPDQYIVTFRDDMSRAEALAITRQLTATHHLRLRHTYKQSFRGFSAVLPPGAVEKLRNHPSIVSVEQNGLFYIGGGRLSIDTVDAPTDVTVTPVGDAQLDVMWTDNATTETGTEIHRSTSGIGGPYSRVARFGGNNVTSYSDTDVVAGQEYCYQIRVGQAGGIRGPFSVPACGIIEDSPPTTVPDSPVGLAATAIDDQRIDLTWNDQSDNESGFRIERALGQGGAFSEIDLTGTNVTSYSDTTLSSDMEYCYRVRAFNSVGDSGYTAEVCATTNSEPPPSSELGAPSSLAANAPDANTVDLTWVDNATAEAGFEIQRSSTGIDGSYSTIATRRNADQTSYTDNAVTSGTEYCYQVRALQNRTVGGDYSNRACATPGDIPPTEPPASPTGLGTTTVNDQRIDLNWADNADNEDGFEIERAPGVGAAFSQLDVVGANVSSYQDSTLVASTEYCYRVRAFNTIGDSAYTLESCSTTDDTPPPGDCTDSGNHDNVALDWGLTKVKADQNANWKATQQLNCGLTPWFFGIDTGVDSDHPDLNVAEIMGFGGGSGEDDNGHGTHTAGTAAAVDGNGGVVGIAPGASIYGFKVCNAAGSCPIDDIVAAVDEVTARKLANPNQPMVANMSLGGGISSTNDSAVRSAVNAGVVFALSAGNGVFGACSVPDDAQDSSPARTGDDLINASGGSNGDTDPVNGILTTTSSTQLDGDANCNFGDPVTIAAPGEGILSSWLNGGAATISGTSMASPHAAGAAILYLHSNPTATPEDVEQALINELDPWFPNDLPNAGGRLDAQGL